MTTLDRIGKVSADFDPRQAYRYTTATARTMAANEEAL